MLLRSAFVSLLIACFGLLPKAQAVSPAPDGGYPGGNTAEGQNAFLSLQPGGIYNTAIAIFSLLSLTDGDFCTGVGAGTLFSNTANENTATGAGALFSNSTGGPNTANGAFALFSNVIASRNTAIGDTALLNNDSDAAGLGNGNTAVGAATLLNNVDGSDNTAVGESAGQNLITGFNNTYIGDFVGFLAADESNTIRIGDLSNGNGAGSLECFIGGIFNNFQPVGRTVVEVTLDLADDRLGWDVGPIQRGSAPAPRGAPQPRSRQQLPAARPQHQTMLNHKVEKLQATVAQQQKQIETLTAQLREQAAQIQKVSAQLEASKPTPQVVNNP